MSQVSRPMQVALLATVLVAVVWLVALRPKPASVGAGAGTPATSAQETPSAPGAEGLAAAVDKAHGAADTASADAQRAGSSSAEGPSAGAASGGATAATSPNAAGSTATTTGAAEPRRAAGAHGARRVASDPGVRMVRAALRAHKSIAIAFVSPKVSDARAVAEELRHVSHFAGRAVTLSVPIAHLSRYGFITRGVDVTVAPTTIVIGPHRGATTIVGFADRFEIEQRLADTLR